MIKNMVENTSMSYDSKHDFIRVTRDGYNFVIRRNGSIAVYDVFDNWKRLDEISEGVTIVQNFKTISEACARLHNHSVGRRLTNTILDAIDKEFYPEYE